MRGISRCDNRGALNRMAETLNDRSGTAAVSREVNLDIVGGQGRARSERQNQNEYLQLHILPRQRCFLHNKTSVFFYLQNKAVLGEYSAKSVAAHCARHK
jgi:hypothetical protein